ncbi:C-type lectin BfL-1 [Anabarilius grahami]|uniref:C-type lectin BfL-1 n=1 Tax=Anabarilius grahami TaxID=495550 RepID=A0A3N0Y2S8_ANAGA|nr:C-type lectin BfL-1 [Anabarilius grahami]
MIWSDAQMYCRQHYTDLATIDDHMDLSELLRSVHQDYKGNVWIGLHRKGAKAPWIWSDQSKSTFMPWAPMQPNNYGSNQYCVIVADGAVNDLDCQNKFPSVCYTDRADTEGEGTHRRCKTVVENPIRWKCLPKEPEV